MGRCKKVALIGNTDMMLFTYFKIKVCVYFLILNCYNGPISILTNML